jgi:hypothetical protein
MNIPGVLPPGRDHPWLRFVVPLGQLYLATALARQLEAAKVDLEDQSTVNPEDSAEGSSFTRHWQIELPSSTAQRVASPNPPIQPYAYELVPVNPSCFRRSRLSLATLAS